MTNICILKELNSDGFFRAECGFNTDHSLRLYIKDGYSHLWHLFVCKLLFWSLELRTDVILFFVHARSDWKLQTLLVRQPNWFLHVLNNIPIYSELVDEAGVYCLTDIHLLCNTYYVPVTKFKPEQCLDLIGTGLLYLPFGWQHQGVGKGEKEREIYMKDVVGRKRVTRRESWRWTGSQGNIVNTPW